MIGIDGYMPATHTVLVVDDSPTIRRMIKVALLPLTDVTCIEAASGLHAIEQLTLARVTLMFLDLNMPDMHGLEVLRFVRSHQMYRHIPVVILTTRADEASRGAVMAAGASVYLTKPFVPQMLAGQVRELLHLTERDAAPGRDAGLPHV